MGNDVRELAKPAGFRFNDGRDWFFEKRFGLFIHWGLYSINAWQEQEQFRRGLARKDYVPLANKFNPLAFDPDEWLDALAAAGMKYLCFTAKHIDGFCMWDSALTSYKVTNTPYGKDVLAMLAEACHRRAVPLCLYYSTPDMNCKAYPNQGRSYELPAPEPGDSPDLDSYVEYVRGQVRELCSNYGRVHGFWWDVNKQTLNVTDGSVNALIRSLQPGIIINNRGFDDGDFSTPERDYADADLELQRRYASPTEACESIGGQSWGYRWNEDYFSTAAITRNIATHMAKGGNYLLNVGPKADGSLPEEALRILRKAGSWMGRTREAFFDAEPASELLANPALLLTRRGDTLYVHFRQAPASSGLILNPLRALPRKASLLNDGRALHCSVDLMPSMFRDGRSYLHVWGVPVDEICDEALVVKLEFDAGALPAAEAVCASSAERSSVLKGEFNQEAFQ